MKKRVLKDLETCKDKYQPIILKKHMAETRVPALESQKLEFQQLKQQTSMSIVQALEKLIFI